MHKSFYCYLIIILISLNSCGGINLPGGDARTNPPDPKARVKKNLEEGKGFRLDTAFKKNNNTNFQFASSNELWRATLDVIDFMPLTSANYSGGIIITDWYSDNNSKESIKITLRFLSNEIKSDAIDVQIFYKNCNVEDNCNISKKIGDLDLELKKEILKRAAIYKKDAEDKNFKPYSVPNLK